MKHNLHKLKTLRAPWMWPTLKAESCRGVNQQIQNAVQQVDVKFYICNVVGREMYSSKLCVLLQLSISVSGDADLLHPPRQQPPKFVRDILPLHIFRDTRIIRSMWPGHRMFSMNSPLCCTFDF